MTTRRFYWAWLPFLLAGAALLTAAAALRQIPRAISGDTLFPGALVFACANLLLAVLLAIAALAAHRRWRTGQRNPGWMTWLLLGGALAVLYTPSFYIWQHQDTYPDGYLADGFSISKRSFREVLRDGWAPQAIVARPVQIRSLGLVSRPLADTDTLCIAQRRQARGFLAVTRHDSWFQPLRQLHGEKPDEALAACNAFRLALLQRHGGLESELLAGTMLENTVLESTVLEGTVLEGTVLEITILESTILESTILESTVPESALLESAALDSRRTAAHLKQHFANHLAEAGTLALRWSDLPAAMRELFGTLLFNDEGLRDSALSLMDVALVLQDKHLIEAALPADGALPHQRYALYELGLAALLADTPPAEPYRPASFSAWLSPAAHPLAIENISRRGGYGVFDYALANLACDAGYAKLLRAQGLMPDEAMPHDLIAQLTLKEKRARPARYSPLTLADLPPHRLTRARTGQCETLAQFYAHQFQPQQSEEHAALGVAAIAREEAAALGKLTLAAYQALGDAALSALPPEQRLDRHSREADEIYDALVFDSNAYPVPDALLAYTHFYAGHFNIGAACGTLAYSAWALNHPQINDIYRTLWQSWRGALPDTAAARMAAQCSIPLLNPPGLYISQTAFRNELLALAGIGCRATLDASGGRFARSVLECAP